LKALDQPRPVATSSAFFEYERPARFELAGDVKEKSNPGVRVGVVGCAVVVW
jgi:hypothetical protein